jgi:uncharacterized protein YjbI with pentapeptide repeats
VGEISKRELIKSLLACSGTPRLAGLNLSGMNLRALSLASADLRGADLRSADLSHADLRSARLDGAKLIGASLRFAYLDHVSFIGSELEGCDFSKARMTGVELTEHQAEVAVGLPSTEQG